MKRASPNQTSMNMNRSITILLLSLAAAAACLALPLRAQTAQGAPDALILQMSTEVIDAVKADKAIQAGDIGKIIALVDSKVMPHVDFKSMTESAVGRNWKGTTPEQQKRLQEEFKTLLVRSYAGALTQVKDQTVQLKRMRGKPEDGEVEVQTEVRGSGEPVRLDYRLEKSADGWKIYNVNVVGVWLVEQYRSVFNQKVSASGIDGLIAWLAERNGGKS
jgi:phospholipid transport system substrate-binding protein